MNVFSKLCLASCILPSLWSCNQNIHFKQDEQGSPVVHNVVPVVPQDPDVYKKTNGDCAPDSSTQLLSCLKCNVPSVPAQEPQLSQKGQYLLDIMTLSCQVPNGSDPKNYKAPTRAQLLSLLNRCSPSLYKDTVASSSQQSVIDQLLSPTGELRKKMFGGLWYKPPYSDRFETFFGLEVSEVRAMLCYDQGIVRGTLYDIGYYENFSSNYHMPPEYVKGNLIRDDLKNCAALSLSDPWKPTAQDKPKKCRYETITGVPGVPISDQIHLWLGNKWTIGAEDVQNGLCVSIKSMEDLNAISGMMTAVAYVCE